MSKNLFPQIAAMLNVDIGEEFKLQEIDNKIYKIELNGFWQRTENQKCWDSMEGSFFELNAILMGKRTVVKMSFSQSAMKSVGFLANKVIVWQLWVHIGQMIRKVCLKKGGYIALKNKQSLRY